MTRRHRSEKQLINELKTGREQLLSGGSSLLLSVLRRRLQSVTRNIFIVRWIPEQGEDLFDVLVDGVTVAHVELPRVKGGSDEVFETWPVEEYRRQLTRSDRRKLELAVQLAGTEPR